MQPVRGQQRLAAGHPGSSALVQLPQIGADIGLSIERVIDIRDHDARADADASEVDSQETVEHRLPHTRGSVRQAQLSRVRDQLVDGQVGGVAEPGQQRADDRKAPRLTPSAIEFLREIPDLLTADLDLRQIRGRRHHRPCRVARGVTQRSRNIESAFRPPPERPEPRFRRLDRSPSASVNVLHVLQNLHDKRDWITTVPGQYTGGLV